MFVESGTYKEEMLVVIVDVKVPRVLLDFLVDSKTIGLLDPQLRPLEFLVATDLASKGGHNIVALDNIIPLVIGDLLDARLWLTLVEQRLHRGDCVLGIQLSDTVPCRNGLGSVLPTKGRKLLLDLGNGRRESRGRLGRGNEGFCSVFGKKAYAPPAKERAATEATESFMMCLCKEWMGFFGSWW